MLRQFRPAHLAQRLQAVHLRHDHIQEHGAEPLRPAEDRLVAVTPVLRLLNVVVGGKNLFQDRPVDRVVIHDQQRLAQRALIPVRMHHCLHPS